MIEPLKKISGGMKKMNKKSRINTGMFFNSLHGCFNFSNCSTTKHSNFINILQYLNKWGDIEPNEIQDLNLIQNYEIWCKNHGYSP